MMKLQKHIRNKLRWNKLRSVRGETLTETLVSVVIIEIVSVALVSMIRTSSHINEASKSSDKALDDAIEIATSHSNLIDVGDSTKYDVVLKVEYGTDEDGKKVSTEQSFKVNVYGSEVGIIDSEEKTEGGGTADGSGTAEGGEEKIVKTLLQMCNYVYPATN